MILADENIPRAVVSALKEQEHDVAMIGNIDRGAGDAQIIARAEREGRVLLTFDKDFGEIAFRSTLSSTCGIVLLRFVPRDPDDAVSLVMAALAMRADWRGRFAVVERDRLRVPRLPSAPRA